MVGSKAFIHRQDWVHHSDGMPGKLRRITISPIASTAPSTSDRKRAALFFINYSVVFF
jgi:hypothetical protein